MNNELLGNWLAAQLFDPKTGQYTGPVPEVDVKSLGRGAPPQISGALRTPLGPGSIGVEGTYQSLPQERPDWGLFLNYRRPF